MNKNAIILTLFLVAMAITFYSNEYFEDKIWNSNKKALGLNKEDRFFLPFPKEYQLISSNSDQRNTTIVITVKKPYQGVRDFYQEILRSKNYEKDYEYEKDNVIEFRYIKENEDLKITITQELDNSIVEFNYHN